MDLYLDSADRADWDRLMPTGVFTGITTNPLLAKRAGLTYPDIAWETLAQHAADLGARELHGQVYGDPAGYAAWAEALMEAGDKAKIRTVVKVPLSAAAIRQVPGLRAAGCPILMTACYSAKQMFVAAALKADYIAPYFGRMEEAGHRAREAMQEVIAIAHLPNVHTRVLVASLRRPAQMCDLAAMGCDCFTISPTLADDLFRDESAMEAIAQFDAAALHPVAS